MNYLEIAQAVRSLSGAQGIGPVTMSGVSGYEISLARFIKDAWVDIQNKRDDWNFMIAKKSFFTIISKDHYSLVDIFGVPNIKVWKRGSFKITDGKISYLTEMNYDDLERSFLNVSISGTPRYYAVEPDHSITLKSTPDKIYQIDTSYFRSPQLLVNDLDVPILPTSFHQLIVYESLKKFAVFLSSPEIYTEYSNKSMVMMGQLMRAELPQKRAAIRRVFV